MREMQVSTAAIICAAGSSSRAGGIKKEYQSLPSIVSGKEPLTVLGAALMAFASCPQIGPIVITVMPGHENGKARSRLPAGLLSSEGGRIHFTAGGPSRRASVHNALLFLEPLKPSLVLIHDGARPWVKPDLIERIIDAAIMFGAVIPGLPLLETPKEFSGFPPEKDEQRKKPAFIKRHLRRAGLCTAQTPQAFRFPEILIAHEKAAIREERENIEYTDDAEVWGEFIGQVAVIPGDPENRKITYLEDLNL